MVIAEAMMEANTKEATATVSPPLPAMVVAGEEAAIPRASPVLLPMDGENESLSHRNAFTRNSRQKENRLRGWDVLDTSGASESKTVPYVFT